MLVLKIILGLVLITGAIISFYMFNEHCRKKFEYQYFSMQSFIAVVISVILILIGYEWQASAAKNGGDTLNGIILIVIGAIIALGLSYLNFKKTNLVYASGGTLVQFAVFGALAYFGVFVLFAGLFIIALSTLAPKNTVQTVFINRQ